LLKAATATVFQYTGVSRRLQKVAGGRHGEELIWAQGDPIRDGGEHSSQGMVQQKFYLSIA
jgi:hypothetical protein